LPRTRRPVPLWTKMGIAWDVAIPAPSLSDEVSLITGVSLVVDVSSALKVG
jgi:hypothetical protein